MDTSVRIGELELATPIMPASGCFGPELAGIADLRGLGALVTKTVFAAVRSGNASERVHDLGFGMLNSVGIPSRGVDGFAADLLPGYVAIGAPLIVSVGGLSDDEYVRVIDELEDLDAPIAGYEVNLSCPNLGHEGGMIGSFPAAIDRVTTTLRARTRRPLLVKLSPVVTSIHDAARAAESAGADALTVCNSFPALAIDAPSRRPVLGMGSGGYSGRAVKPLALKLVHDAASAARVPVIGCGGIASAADAVDFLMVGATAVQVGTATFANPNALAEVASALPSAVRAVGVDDVASCIGALHVPVDDPVALPLPSLHH